MQILVLNGANLDVLARRDPGVYGGLSLNELERRIYQWANELDIVARRRTLLVVVEVRTRGPGSYESALSSITWKKRARVIEATGRLLREGVLPLRLVQRVRIDVASVTFEGGGASVEYVEGAITR
jgi:Holliday junction resolvase-like predicted endonuclease